MHFVRFFGSGTKALFMSLPSLREFNRKKIQVFNIDVVSSSRQSVGDNKEHTVTVYDSRQADHL